MNKEHGFQDVVSHALAGGSFAGPDKAAAKVERPVPASSSLQYLLEQGGWNVFPSEEVKTEMLLIL
jgi:hypothetical protein